MNHSLRPGQLRRPHWAAFSVSALALLAMLLPFVLLDRGFFLYCGDFNSQQIPFYYYCQQFIKSGGGAFSWATDLGSGFLNTYSFYTLGSPFFYLSCLLPARLLPYAMVPLLALKFGVGGLGAWLYIRRYTRTDQAALLGSVLFTLSGWGVYNIFFNHFIDCMALFPYLLAALDSYVYDGRRAVLPLAVAVNLLNNYFFFLGEALFLALYFFIKLAAGDYRVSLKRFFLLAFEVLTGCLLGCLLILPAAASLLNNPRTDSFSNGYGLLAYGRVQQYFAILRSLLVPPDPPYLPGIFSEATVKWTSMTAYLPLVSLSCVFAYSRARHRCPHRRLLAVSLAMALVPALNSAFYAFNSSYYARWYYMPVLVMALVSAQSLEQADLNLPGGMRTAALLTLAFAAFGLVPAKQEDSWQLGVADNAAQFWLVLLLALLGLLIFYALYTHWQRHPALLRALLAGVLGFGVLCGAVHIAIGKFPQRQNDANYKLQNYDVIEQVELPDDHFYRIDTYNCYDNLGLFLNRPCIRCFNSTVAPSILEFYPEVGVKRDVSSKPEITLYALRGLLSVDYLLMPAASRTAYEAEETRTGFVFDGLTGDGVYARYRNENPVPMGLVFDYYVLPEAVETVNREKRGNLYLRAIGLSEEQARLYAGALQPLPEEQLSAAALTYDSYLQDCADRRATGCDSFTAHQNGFSATVTLAQDNLVLFSVPYDEGFRATVNGEEAPVLCVDGGLIAIPAPAGPVEIELTLVPKWLPLSSTLTLLGAVLYAGYGTALLLRRRAGAPPPRPRLVPLEASARHPRAPWLLADGSRQLPLPLAPEEEGPPAEGDADAAEGDTDACAEGEPDAPAAEEEDADKQARPGPIEEKGPAPTEGEAAAPTEGEGPAPIKKTVPAEEEGEKERP